jgi:hypothetical protein
MKMRSPGLATSRTAVSPIGDDPEYVLPRVGLRRPCSICSFLTPAPAPRASGTCRWAGGTPPTGNRRGTRPPCSSGPRRTP